MNIILSFALLSTVFIAHLGAWSTGWPPKWLDLPDDDYAHLLKVDPAPEFDQLHALLADYHALPKTEIGSLALRIEKLDQIQDHLEEMKNTTGNALLKKQLPLILRICRNKSWYLTQLKEGYASGRLELEYSGEVIRELTEIPPKNRDDFVIYLHHDKLFNPYVVEYWGDFWLEYIDPCHRKLWSYLGLWKSLKSQIPFFLWLEEQNLPVNVPFAHYCSREELSHCACDIIEGRLFYRDTGYAVGETEPEDLLFCVNLDREVLVIKGSETIHHTSLTSGRPVLAVGRWAVDDGEIYFFSLESGHHSPSVQAGKMMVRTLQEMGIDFPSDLEFGFFNPFGMHRMDLQTFMDTETQILETMQK